MKNEIKKIQELAKKFVDLKTGHGKKSEVISEVLFYAKIDSVKLCEDYNSIDFTYGDSELSVCEYKGLKFRLFQGENEISFETPYKDGFPDLDSYNIAQGDPENGAEKLKTLANEIEKALSVYKKYKNVVNRMDFIDVVHRLSCDKKNFVGCEAMPYIRDKNIWGVLYKERWDYIVEIHIDFKGWDSEKEINDFITNRFNSTILTENRYSLGQMWNTTKFKSSIEIEEIEERKAIKLVDLCRVSLREFYRRDTFILVDKNYNGLLYVFNDEEEDGYGFSLKLNENFFFLQISNDFKTFEISGSCGTEKFPYKELIKFLERNKYEEPRVNISSTVTLSSDKKIEPFSYDNLYFSIEKDENGLYSIIHRKDFSFDEKDKLDENVFYVKWENCGRHYGDTGYHAYITIDDGTDVPIYLFADEDANFYNIRNSIYDGNYFHHDTSYLRDGMIAIGKVGEPISNEIDLSEMTWNAVRRVNNQ